MGELFNEELSQETVDAFANVFPDDPGPEQGDNPEGTPAQEQAAPVAASAATGAVVDDAPDDAEPQGPEELSIEQKIAAIEQSLEGTKFKTPDEFIKAYENVESYAGRMAWERDEALRIAQMAEMQARQQQQQAPQQPQQQIDWDALIEDKPGVAAQYAYQQGDRAQLARAMEAWEEIAPGTPQVWIDNLRLQGELAQMRQESAPTVEAVKEQKIQQEVAEVYSAINQRYPDYSEYESSISREVALISQGGNPALMETLNNGTQDQRFNVLENLYLAAKGRAAGDMSTAAARAAKIHAEETQRAKDEAITTSSTSSGHGDSSPAQQVGQQWAEILGTHDDHLVFPDGSKPV